MVALPLLLACTAGPAADTGPASTAGTTTTTPRGTTTPPGTATTTSGATTPGSTATLPEPTVCINEFMASNGTTIADDTGAYPDWIELHNATDHTVPLDGWSITDDLEEPDKHVLGGSLAIQPGDFLLLWADGMPELGPTHLGFLLAKDGEELGLYDDQGFPVNELTYGAQVTDWSAARYPDCAWKTWFVSQEPTPGAPNAPPP